MWRVSVADCGKIKHSEVFMPGFSQADETCSNLSTLFIDTNLFGFRIFEEPGKERR